MMALPFLGSVETTLRSGSQDCKLRTQTYRTGIVLPSDKSTSARTGRTMDTRRPSSRPGPRDHSAARLPAPIAPPPPKRPSKNKPLDSDQARSNASSPPSSVTPPLDLSPSLKLPTGFPATARRESSSEITRLSDAPAKHRVISLARDTVFAASVTVTAMFWSAQAAWTRASLDVHDLLDSRAQPDEQHRSRPTRSRNSGGMRPQTRPSTRCRVGLIIPLPLAKCLRAECSS